MPSTHMPSTQVSMIIKAPRRAVYQACLDPVALAAWRAPDNMKARVHNFEPREGGTYRMSLTYQDPSDSPGGKTSADTDTFRGRFIEIVPEARIVEAVAFETRDPAMAGEMTMTTSFVETPEGTEVTILCQDLPSGIRLEDNAAGCRSSLRNLAALLEGAPGLEGGAGI
jgi:uncharacterized protein YndB with AHSA1/START domain